MVSTLVSPRILPAKAYRLKNGSNQASEVDVLMADFVSYVAGPDLPQRTLQALTQGLDLLGIQAGAVRVCPSPARIGFRSKPKDWSVIRMSCFCS